MRASPFVAARRSAILVPGFYAERKKMSSDTSVDSDSGSSSGRGRALEQPQGVTVSNNDSSEAEDIIASLRRNEGDGIIREDSAIQNRDKEIITGELKTPKEIEIAGEVSNEELSLA